MANLTQPAAVDVKQSLAAGQRRVPFGVLVALFVVSGATGLIDQVCFSKYLTYIVGATAYAVSAVLAAFMAGLAIGAHLGGRLSSRIRRPLLAYGVLELVVAGSVLLAPAAFAALTPLYISLARTFPDSVVALSALRWLLAMLVVVVPTTAMGATLPFLTRALGEGATDGEAEAAVRKRQLGSLYAANTLGGALGSLGAAYLVLPALGLSLTLWTSAGLSLAIAVVAIVLGRGASEAAAPAPESSTGATAGNSGGAGTLLLGLAFGSGYLVFSSEVVFTHLLALVVGNSAYAFGLILAVFLGCLFLGASRAPSWSARWGEPALALSLLLTGAALAVTLPAWDLLPLLFERAGQTVTTFEGRELVRGLVALIVLALPVSLMGLTFPLLLQRVGHRANAGQLVGQLTAVNTIGAVAGSLVTGYLVLPAVGSQRMLGFCALLFVFGGLATGRGLEPRPRQRLALGALVVAVLILLAPRWDLVRLTNGTNVYFQDDKPLETLLFIEEDIHGGVTTVMQIEEILTLYTNGKFQGNNSWEVQAQRALAHYPSLFAHARPEHKALVIGLGTGTTVGTIMAYPWQKVDAVEISPAIVRAAGKYFSDINGHALTDPGVELHLADGRNFLALGQTRYGLVSIEISSIWFAGAANLYSKQFYHLVHERLQPDGIFQQWVQMHHISKRDFATILHTLATEFKHVALFFGGGQGILVASDSPLVASRARIDQMQADPKIAAVVPDGRRLTDMIQDVILAGDGVQAYIEDSAREAGVPVSALISDDDNLYLEYATPRGNVLPWSSRQTMVEDIRRFRTDKDIDAMLVP